MTELLVRRRFFVLFAITVAALVISSFVRTFFVPLARSELSVPWYVYVHAALFFAWVGLLVTQTSLAASRKLRLHRGLGWAAAVLVPLMFASGLRVAFWATDRDIGRGPAGPPITFFFGQILDMVMFGGFAIAAVLTRGIPETHKRLMLLATLALLGAPVGRLPVIGAYSNAITFTLLAVVAAFDLTTRRSLHGATVAGGLALIIGTLIQDPLGRLDEWQHFVAKMLA